MPKFPTFPTLYDDVLTVSISKLNKWGYLKPGQRQRATITWSRNENKVAAISININTQCQSPYIELDYTTNDVPVKYAVQLVSVPSNIGRGVVWFFICPHTGKRCRKLYKIGEKFLHREAFRGCFYEKQLKSKHWRALDSSLWGRQFLIDDIYEQVYSKHFKITYSGRPTKRFLKLLKQAKNAGDSRLAELLKKQ